MPNIVTQIHGEHQIKEETIVNSRISETAGIATAKLADGLTFLKNDGTVVMLDDLDINSNKLTHVANPEDNGDAVNKVYVDSTFMTATAVIRRDSSIEIPDGQRTVFHLQNTPESNSEQVFKNGLILEPGAQADYTISGDAITFGIAPDSEDRLRVSYISQV